MLNFKTIKAASVRLNCVVHRTPVLHSAGFNKLVNATVFLKCENFQRTGSFKFRGAYNAMAQLSEAERRRGVIAYSSGNHAQAVALAGHLLGIHTTLVMPQQASPVKLAATREYGSEVITYDKLNTSREALSAQIVAKQGLILIPPFDHPDVIAGQGTAGLEFLQQACELDTLLVCLGGGGLLAGCALAVKSLYPKCRVIGVEPAAGNDGQQSLEFGRLVSLENIESIADGACTACLGTLTFPIIKKYVDEIVTVSDNELISTMFYLWERLKLVVEPTGALAVAALFHGKVTAPKQRVGVLISGGNVDLRQAGQWFAQIAR